LVTAEHELRHEQLREANEQLVLAALGAQELLAAAEEARSRQSEMLAMVANELSNPFAPIRLAAATLGLPGAEKTLLPRVQAIIEQQVDKMSRLVSELLDPRQGSTRASAIERLIFDAADPIGDAVEVCRPAMDRRQQTLEASISRPLEMNGDPASLMQILVNLLSNASVYTRNGGRIRVGADVVGGSLLLTVADSGPGSAQDALGAIADPFVLQPRASPAIEDGVGIRLKAVREMVESHGGTVVATTADDGHGSQVTVSLPTEAINDDDLELGTQ
jgi:signal transduction histidine kinase